MGTLTLSEQFIVVYMGTLTLSEQFMGTLTLIE